MTMLGSVAIGLYGTMALVLAAGEVRCWWRLRRGREVAQQLVDYAEAAHLNDCRHGVHRTTLDVAYADVYCTGDPYVHEIRERCVDCGVTVPFGRVTTFTLPHRKKKAHG